MYNYSEIFTTSIVENTPFLLLFLPYFIGGGGFLSNFVKNLHIFIAYILQLKV